MECKLIRDELIFVGLKTAKGTKQLKLDPSIYEAMQKERVEVGDVIYIEANSGAVKRTGRSDAFATEFDLEVRVGIFLLSQIAFLKTPQPISKTSSSFPGGGVRAPAEGGRAQAEGGDPGRDPA